MADKQPHSKGSPDHILYDVNQAAKFLGVSAGTIRRWAKSTHLKGTKVGQRGDWRFTREALLASVGSSPYGAGYYSSGSSVSIERQSGYVMQFYEEDTFLVNKVREYVLESLEANKTCIVVATHEHLAALHESLRGEIDVEQMKLEGRLAVYDAATIAGKFIRNGKVDHVLCRKVLQEILQCAASFGRPIGAVTELAALLWRRGEKEMAVEIEQYRTVLAEKYDFSLFGAYPMEAFSDKASDDLVI